MNDTFIKGFEALSKSSSKYLGFALDAKSTYAKLDIDDKSRIHNAYICVQRGASSTIWEIENGVPKSIPASLCLWFKNQKKLGLCIQDTEEDESYIFFGDEDSPFPSNCTILAIVENEDLGLCLYVDSSSEHLIWLHEYKSGSRSALAEFTELILKFTKKENVKNDLSEIKPKLF